MNQETYLKGWISFLTSLLLAFFIGGAFKASFSQSFLAQKTLDYWEKKGIFFDLSLDRGELILSDGIFPALAVRLNRVELKSRQKCSFFHAITIEGLRVSLLSQIITAENFIVTPSPCVPSKSKFLEKEFLDKISYSLEQQWPWLVRAFQDLFDVFYIQNWSYGDLISGKKLTVTAYMKQSLLDLKGDFVLADDQWDFDIQMQQGLVDWKMKTEKKEAVIETEGSFNYPTYDVISKTKLSFLPVSRVLDVVSILSSDFKKVYAPLLWVSCHVTLKGFVENPKSMAMNISECGLSGEDNKLFIDDIIIFPFSDKYFEPFEIKVERLSFDKVSELPFFQNRIPFEKIQKKGYFQGKLEIFSLSSFGFKGALLDYQIAPFAPNSNSLEFDVYIKDKNYEISLNHIKWDNDEELSPQDFQGKVLFTGNLDTPEVFIDINHSYFKLPENLQKNILEAGISDLKLKGKGVWLNKSILNFQGTFLFPSVKKSPYALKNISLKLDISENHKDKIQGDVKIEFLEVEKDSEFHKNFKKVVSRYINIDKKPLRFEKIKSSVFLDLKTGTIFWKKASFSMKNVSLRFRGEGSFQDKVLSGKIFVSPEGSSFYRPWKVSNSLFEPSFEK